MGDIPTPKQKTLGQQMEDFISTHGDALSALKAVGVQTHSLRYTPQGVEMHFELDPNNWFRNDPLDVNYYDLNRALEHIAQQMNRAGFEGVKSTTGDPEFDNCTISPQSGMPCFKNHLSASGR